jgi:hypothetical protein
MFNENSGLVKVWVRLIMENKRTIAEVPDLSNLRTVVESVMTQ